jgi:hypothetical protein
LRFFLLRFFVSRFWTLPALHFPGSLRDWCRQCSA